MCYLITCHGHIMPHLAVRLLGFPYVHTYIRDPVKLRLRHLYQVEFCSFMVRYPTAGASVYCGHISSFSTKMCRY